LASRPLPTDLFARPSPPASPALPPITVAKKAVVPTLPSYSPVPGVKKTVAAAVGSKQPPPPLPGPKGTKISPGGTPSTSSPSTSMDFNASGLASSTGSLSSGMASDLPPPPPAGPPDESDDDAEFSDGDTQGITYDDEDNGSTVRGPTSRPNLDDITSGRQSSASTVSGGGDSYMGTINRRPNESSDLSSTESKEGKHESKGSGDQSVNGDDTKSDGPPVATEVQDILLRIGKKFPGMHRIQLDYLIPEVEERIEDVDGDVSKVDTKEMEKALERMEYWLTSKIGSGGFGSVYKGYTHLLSSLIMKRFRSLLCLCWQPHSENWSNMCHQGY
jgi:hypothetical protein